MGELMNKSIYGAAAFLAFACSAQTGLAQDGSLSRPQFACADGAQCDSALWGINKQGYALIASLSVPRVYQVCMGHLPQNPTRWFNVYVKVDNVTLNFGDASLGAPLASGGCVVVEGKKIEVVNTGGIPFQRNQGFYRRVETTK